MRDARRCAPLEPPLEKPVELMTQREKMRTGLRYLPMVPVIFRWKNLPITTYLARYKNDFLREALKCHRQQRTHVGAGARDGAGVPDPQQQRLCRRRFVGFCDGHRGPLRPARRHGAIQSQGRLRSKSKTTAPPACECDDGTVVPASTVVSCADGHTTIFKMLDGRFVDKKIRYLYENCQPFPAIIQVSLGIKKIFPDAPHTLNLPLPQPLRVDDQTRHDRLEVETFGSDSALCPEGTMS